MFKRDWELIDKTILPSPFEQFSEGRTDIKMELAPISFFKKKACTYVQMQIKRQN